MLARISDFFDVKTKREAVLVEERHRHPRRLPRPSIKEERQDELASLSLGFYNSISGR